MAKAFIQFLTKNYSLYGDRKEIETEIVPRVGELIDAGALMDLRDDEPHNFMVLSVIYKAQENGFAAYITARQWLKGWRHEVLQERGWLTPNNPMELQHDEDDSATLERL